MDFDFVQKGLPFDSPAALDRIREQGWNLKRGDLPLPALILRETELAHNIREMADWCSANDILLAPHGKTTMCPRIFQRQMEAGAWAITVAHVNQAAVCVRHGIRRIVIANQVVGRGNIRFLAELLRAVPDCEIYCLVDSVEAVQHLDSEWQQAGGVARLRVLIEFGRDGWRTGVRSFASALDVHSAVQHAERSLRFSGVEAFEGAAANDTEAEEFLCWVRDSGLALTSGVPAPIFSVGGSSYLGPVLSVMKSLPGGWRPVLRSGCYVTHDHGIYADRQRAAAATSYGPLPQFRAALELWAAVQSTPGPQQAILTFGKRDCAYDLSLPVPIDLPGGKITAINDQHGYLSCPEETRPHVGQILRLGISHPCTAFDKWRAIPVVDDDYNVIDVYSTCF